MLENLLRQYDNLGRPDQLIEIISLAKQADSIPRTDFTSIGIPIGAIEFLAAVEILKHEDERVLLIEKSVTEENFIFCLIEKLFQTLERESLLSQFVNHRNLLYDTASAKVSVQNHKIPLLFSSLRNLLVGLDFFVPDEIIKFEFYIHPDYRNWFVKNAVPSIESAEIGDNSLENLQAQLVRQADLGKEAEAFVLAYEKRLRTKHRKVENIRIISEIDTHAGFDILSYASDKALVLDKFIEVKSYSGVPQFYWSANEMRVAKEKGGDYYLYLVDREVMGNAEYHPTQIQNPGKVVFDSDVWKVSGDGFYVIKS